ncbi:MAG: urea amidolyase [Alphaproteobacteria bacterium]|nr:MAG: urea amidolyase [Alphaproteobacteria bacterium]
MTLQDLGRPGLIGQGVSVGGAADRLALLEAAALLGLARPGASIEMAGSGGTFVATAPMRLALTGAPMRADIDGQALAWNAVHLLSPGQRLTIGGAREGTYGYLTPAGGFDVAPFLGSVSAHLAAGIGGLLRAGVDLPLGEDPHPGAPATRLDVPGRFSGGTVRLMPGPQTDLFDAAVRARFFATPFRRGPQANRQGMELLHDGPGYTTAAASNLASDFIVPGDVQMTGAGAPFVLLCECQTIGGYPRIGTVLAEDLPRLAQAPAGAPIRFRPVSLEEADAVWRDEQEQLAALRARVRPLVRDPHAIRDLLAYQLISGVTCGDDLERT